MCCCDQKKGENYLVDANDTQSVYVSGNSNTVDYLKVVVKNSNINCEMNLYVQWEVLSFSVKLCTLNLKMIQILIWLHKDVTSIC